MSGRIQSSAGLDGLSVRSSSCGGVHLAAKISVCTVGKKPRYKFKKEFPELPNSKHDSITHFKY